MNNRRKFAALVGAEKVSLQFEQLEPFVSTARQALRACGVTAMVAMAVMFFRPELTDHIKTFSPFWTEDGDDTDVQSMAFADMLELPDRKVPSSASDVAYAVNTDAPVHLSAASLLEQQRVTGWLAKRYRIAGTASKMLVDAAYAAGQEVKLDPLLILSVMAIESRLNPFAESSVGAQGLMQVMPKVHHDKFDDHGGARSVLNPVANIKVGAQILKDAIRRTGTVEAGLKLYVGAGNMETDGGYGAKVLAEYSRLQMVASGKRVPTFTRPPAPAAETVHEAKTEPVAVPVPLQREGQEPA